MRRGGHRRVVLLTLLHRVMAKIPVAWNTAWLLFFTSFGRFKRHSQRGKTWGGEGVNREVMTAVDNVIALHFRTMRPSQRNRKSFLSRTNTTIRASHLRAAHLSAGHLSAGHLRAAHLRAFTRTSSKRIPSITRTFPISEEHEGCARPVSQSNKVGVSGRYLGRC